MREHTAAFHTATSCFQVCSSNCISWRAFKASSRSLLASRASVATREASVRASFSATANWLIQTYGRIWTGMRTHCCVYCLWESRYRVGQDNSWIWLGGRHECESRASLTRWNIWFPPTKSRSVSHCNPTIFSPTSWTVDSSWSRYCRKQFGFSMTSSTMAWSSRVEKTFITLP